ncbi:hypothetical protein ACET3X_007808 [Alternaria dauci]|uniref:Uncharacterized protein n=1 Tax=Alternaria dauci TaxID=48095 RepID=A0ABR3UDX4_9PLEO
MSDENTPKGAGGKVQGWTEREFLVYLLSALDSANIQIDYNSAPVPAGRNANGCRQKINKTKLALKPEIDALKAGLPIAAAFTSPVDGSPTKKAVTPRKRKPKADDEGNTGEVTPKKARGRPKKNKEPAPKTEEDQQELGVKTEVNSEDKEYDTLKEAESI